ncbi:non-ribosomal peptide synthase amino acid adenylation [Ophiostoma piceae UAMH 11346]|uniref:Non-ribosomal peptide synthase amino acid adenylation n=1 Tax=Ophiostoma piceae (strain UAMH 11346) TaxID=1262450 RepID=S3C5D0_OPHP1|nr:non-ribosomal peptide synthase amino acid adenylation [Ophiostoma piceae UAMH 11346]
MSRVVNTENGVWWWGASRAWRGGQTYPTNYGECLSLVLWQRLVSGRSKAYRSSIVTFGGAARCELEGKEWIDGEEKRKNRGDEGRVKGEHGGISMAARLQSRDGDPWETGDWETGRLGDWETGRLGDWETGDHSAPEEPARTGDGLETD